MKELAAGWHRRAFFRPLAEQLEPRVVLTGLYDTVDPAWFAAADAGDGWSFIGPVPAAAAVSSVQSTDSAESRWLVRLTPAGVASTDGIGSVAELLSRDAARFQTLRGLGLPGLVVVSTNVSREFAAEVLAANPLVDFFEQDHTIITQRMPNDPDFVAGSMVGLHNTGQFGGTDDADIDAPEIWDETVGSPSVVVGVIDSGVDATHPDLYLNIWINQGEIPSAIKSQLTAANADINGDSLFTFYDLNNCAATSGIHDSGVCNWTNGPSASLLTDFNANGYIDALDLLEDPRWADGIDTDGNGFIDDFFGWNFRSTPDEPFAPNNPSDLLGHGTHVSGTIGAIGNNGVGVTGVNWQTSIMGLKFLDPSNQGRTSDAIRAINYATMMKTDYGVNVPVTNNSWGQAGDYSASLEAAIRAAGDAGILFVAAAGNGNILGRGVDNDRTPFYPASYELDNIIAVAASDANDNLAQFSNFGAISVDIAAPGVGILSTLPGGRYGTANGTSMATPHVAGTAALIWSQLPAATPVEVRSAIMTGGNTAPELTSFVDRVASDGRLNALQALEADAFAPAATLVSAPDITSSGGVDNVITVRYSGRDGIDGGSIDHRDLVVTHLWGPRAILQTELISNSVVMDGTTVTASYRVLAPGGHWDVLDFGKYSIASTPDEVLSTTGNQSVRARLLGSFSVQMADATSVFYVNTTADSVDHNIGDGVCADADDFCSLRAAIQESNARFQLPPPPVEYEPVTVASSDVPKTIEDDSSVSSLLTTNGITGYISDVDVHLSITHSFDNDVSAYLTSPGGTRVALFTRVGGAGDHFTSTVLDDDAISGIEDGTAPFTGRYRPEQPLTNLNGEDANGTWTLEIQDNASGDTGTLDGWSLVLTTSETPPSPTPDTPVLVAPAAPAAHYASETTPQAIVDNGTFVSQLSVTNFIGALIDVNVRLDLLHTRNEQVSIFLSSPSGTRIELFSNVGGSGQSFRGTILDDEAAEGIGNGQAPFDGHFQPSEPLATLDGEDPNGTWSLEVVDTASGDTGTLDSWALELTSDAAVVILGEGSHNLTLPRQPSLTFDSTDVPKGMSGSQAVTSQLEITGVAYTDFDLAVHLDLQYSYDRLLAAELISPQGTRVLLFNGVGDDGEDFTGTILDDAATMAIDDGQAPFTGRFKPLNNLDAFQGEDPTGTWTLELAGTILSSGPPPGGFPGDPFPPGFPGDDEPSWEIVPTGSLLNWSLAFEECRSCISPDRGDLDVTSPVAIIGSTSGSTIIDAEQIDRAFKVGEYAAVQLSRVHVTDGYTTHGGGGVLSNGNLLLVQSQITRNTALGGGGGVQAASGHLTLASSSITDNFATAGGGVHVGLGATFKATGASLVKNTAINAGGGAYLETSQATYAEFVNTTISNNRAPTAGGIGVKNNMLDIDDSNPSAFNTTGRYLVFDSYSSNYSRLDDDTESDVFVFDSHTKSFELISIGADNARVTGRGFGSGEEAISDDGRFVVFQSISLSGLGDVFIRDRVQGVTERISNAVDGGDADGTSDGARISGDGRYVVFASRATNLVATDNNGKQDIFLYDRISQSIQLISRSDAGTLGDGDSNSASISSDGRFIAFESAATNLVDNDANAKSDIFVFDRVLDSISRTSVAADGTQADQGSSEPAISGDGRYVAFSSLATNLVTNDANNKRDVFVFDRQTGVSDLVSVAADGTQANGGNDDASISDDGRYVAFHSSASNLVPGDHMSCGLFGCPILFDRNLRVPSLVSLSNQGKQPSERGGFNPVISGDGRLVAFSSDADDLTPNDPTGSYDFDIFIVNTRTHGIDRLGSDMVPVTTLEHVTVADNYSKTGGAVDGHLSLLNSLLTRNYEETGNRHLDVSGNAVSFGHNLLDWTTTFSSASTDRIDPLLDKGLGPLELAVTSEAEHWVQPLLAGSAAIDAADPDAFSGVDQLGRSRPQYAGTIEGIRADVGALEMQFAAITGIVFLDRDQDGVRDVDEIGLPNISVVRDANRDGVLDAGRPSVRTTLDDATTTTRSELGQFVFAGLEPGLQWVQVDVPEGWELSVPTPKYERVSVAATGAQGDDHSTFPVLSETGRFVAFVSEATTLVPGDTNGKADIFVVDRHRNTIERISVADDSTEADGDSSEPVISGDGRFVAFVSAATNLVPEDTNGKTDIFLFDRWNRTIARISNGIDGQQADGISFDLSISADGQIIAFASLATNLVSDDTNLARDVFVFDRSSGMIERISVANDGMQSEIQNPNRSYVPEAGSYAPAVSADGRFVAFSSKSSVLISGAPFITQILVHDRELKTLTSVSNAADGSFGDDDSHNPSISDDGRYVAFISEATNLVTGGASEARYDAYVADRIDGTIVRVSVANDGTLAGPGTDFISYIPRISISGDGAFVLFESDSTNLVTPATENRNVYRVNNQTHTLQLQSAAPAGAEGTGASLAPQISRTGQVLAFHSRATNLAQDSNTFYDVFVIRNSERQSTTAVLLFANEQVDLTFGLVPLNGEIRGRVFEDAVENGVFDPGEPAVTGVVVYLDSDGDGKLDPGERTAAIQADGTFAFLNLPTEMAYQVRTTVPQGYSLTLPTSQQQGSWSVYLPAGSTVSSRDFGFTAGSTGGQFENAAVDGMLFSDEDSSGDRQSNEPGFAGVTVFLDLNDDGIRQFDEPRTITAQDDPNTTAVNEAGKYSFAGLGNRNYTVRAVLDSSRQIQTAPLGNELTKFTKSFTAQGGAASNPQDVVVADFTRDGIPDLAVALFERNVVSILPGTGGGEFLAPIDIDLPNGATGPVALLSGDFNGLGSPDLAVANSFSGSVTILLDFDSTTRNFTSKTKVNVGSGPRSLAAGYFDNDTDLDLVVANEKSNSLTILRNNGSGTFTAVASTLAVGKNPFSVVAVQLTDDNGDQVADENDHVDLVVANFGQYPTGADLGSVSVLYSNGSGGFTAATNYAAGFGPAGVAAGDFNGDGYPDVAVANFLSDTITLLINKQDGTFPTNRANRPSDLSAGTGPADLEAADLDNDGDDDLVIINRNSKDISILRNQFSQLGSLGFEPGESFGLGDFPTAVQLSVSTGDVNRDGLLDLAVTNGTNNNVSVFVNQLVGGAHRVGLTGVETVSGLNFGIQPLNIPPTLNAIANPTAVNEDDPTLFVIPLEGITAGTGESQDLGLSVSSDNGALFSQLNHTYTPNAATGSVNYLLAPNANGTAVVTVTVTDAGLDGNLATAADNGSFSRSFTVTVRAVNDDPQAVGDPATTAEDTAVVIDWDDLLQNDTDVDSPSSQWLIASVEDAREGVATNQPGSRSVRFVPRGDFHGTASFRYTLRDGDGGTSTASVTVTVTPQNDAPTDLRLDQLTVDENSDGAVIGNLAVDDVDLPGDAYSWTVSDSRLEVTSSPWTLKLRSGESFDHEATQSVTVTVTGRDSANAPITRNFTLTILDVNEFAPVLNDTQFSILENQAANTLVGTVTATDQDRTQAPVYSITSGNIGNAFSIDSATGAIRTTSSLNHEARSRYDLGVTVTDNLSPAKFSSAIVTVLVQDVNEFDPVLGSSTLSVNENTPANTMLAQLAAQDNDTSQSISYAILSGNNSGAFSLDAATGQLRVADASKLNFEAVQQFVLSVRATDSAANSRFDDATVTVNLVDVNEFDPVLGDAAFSIAENTPANTVVGQVAATDQDSLQTVTYSILSGNTGGAFGLNAVSGQLRVADASKLDYETAQQFILTIKAADNGQPSRSDTATVTITLGDENEFDPVLEDAFFSTSSTSVNDTLVGRLLATDGDRQQQATYAIVSGNASGAFRLDGTSGELRVADETKLAPGTVSLTVRATDNGQPSRFDDATVTINILGGTQSQPVLDDVTFSLVENSVFGSLVGRLTATDQDAGQVISYAILAGNGSGAFSLDPSTGELRVANATKIDFEATPRFTLTIRATDNGQPQLSDTATVLVNLQDVNEFDPALNDVAWTLAENSPTNTLVGQVLATDQDTAQSVTYAILSGNDTGGFALDAATGEVRVADASKLDFETVSQFTLSIRATDSGTPSRSRDATVTISLQDANEFDPEIADAGFSIDENTANGVLIGQLDATDGDTSQSVGYSILSGTAAGAFRLDSASGELRVADASKLDFEATKQFTLTVKATDNGQPARSATATVTVSLRDVNEFDPLLDDTNWTLNENSAVNTLVGRVVAVDQDTAQSVSFAIISGNETGAFTLHATTGEVRVADPSKLDFEATPQFTLSVRATDNGTPSRSRDATVTIDLLDVNEFDPVLADATFTLDENVAVDTLVGQLGATDADTSQRISFSIQSGNGSGAFRLDPASGELRVADASKLDFEATSQFVLTIRATDNGVPARTDAATVAIILRDVNESPPLVSDAAYNIPENSPNGTIVGTIPVSDLESQQAHTFQILAGNFGDAFAVDATTGVITVADSGQLDRETRAQFVLTVRVDDAVAPAQFATGTITIDINDANEFGPTVGDDNFTIREDAGVGEVVGTLVASDPDSTGSIEFALIGGNAAGVFELDAATGEIRIRDTSALDYETRQEYLLFVTARETVAPGRSDAAVVTITVEDVNEFDPVLNDATFTLNENAATGTLVGHVSATDRDSSQNVRYAILSGNDSGAFSLNASSGELRVADTVALDFEVVQQFSLTIQATDNGQPARSSTATVTVDLRDVNEFPPVLNDTSFALNENSSVGTVVGRLTATDADVFQSVTYTILSGNSSGAFAVDSSTGEIRAANAAALNFETTPRFTLAIQVTDNGLPTRSDTASIIINLQDVNEFAPVIDDATFTLAENTANNTLIGQVVATDNDTAQMISYAIQAGNSSGAFRLNATTGELRVADAAKLDFEAIQQFVLTIRATDSGQPARSETATVTVDLLDINEFAPVLNNATFSLDENSNPDTVVGAVTATDGDTRQTVVYTIQSGNSSGAFGVNTSTGELRVVDAAQLDFEVAPQYTLTILATDSGQPSRSGTATVTIDVRDVNEFDPVLDDSHLTLNENSMNGTIFGQIAGNDEDSAQTLRYAIVSGNSGGAFTMNADNGELRVADANLLDFEATPQFTLTIQATDDGQPARSATATVVVDLFDVNEFAPALADVTFSINENRPADTVIRQLQATDADSSQTVTYSIQSGNSSGAFALDANSGQLRIADAAKVDFEATPRFILTIRATDSGLQPQSTTATVTVNVRDVNEFDPVVGDATFTLNENAAADTLVGQVSATDNDTAQTISYSIQAGNDGGAFRLDSASGELRVADATKLDFETTQQFTLTIRATDNGVPARFDDATWTIDLLDVNEFAPVLDDASYTLSKRSEGGTLVGQLTATDQDTAQNVRLEILAGDPNGIFSIDSTTGELRVADATRLSAVVPELLLTVRATDDGQPIRSATATVTIQLTGLNEPPAAEDDASATDEDTAIDVAVLTNDRDPNTGDTLILVSASSAQGARVTINADGTLRYDPSQVQAFQDLRKGESVEDEVTYTIEDDGGLQATATLVLTVHGNHDWHNATRPFDTNRDGSVTPADALVVINRLNDGGPGELPGMVGVAALALDTNDDGVVSPVDALQIVNSLNGFNGEGESAEIRTAVVPGLQRHERGGISTMLLSAIRGTSPSDRREAGNELGLPNAGSPVFSVSSAGQHTLPPAAVDRLLQDEELFEVWFDNDETLFEAFKRSAFAS